MTISETSIKGLLVIKPQVFEDDRGIFFESFNFKLWTQYFKGAPPIFVQDNESHSNKNVLRGLHFQSPPHSQGKLVRVTQGAVLDVVVDLRKDSPTYKTHFKILLSERNKKQLYVPEGFAHGFLALEDNTRFLYKCTDYYNREAERSIVWNDPDLNIDWEVKNPILSKKDKISLKFSNFENPF